MDTLLQDLRHAARRLLRAPGFTAVAVATLALGIGSGSAVFSVVHGVLLRSLPFAEPERLVRLYGTEPGGDGRTSVSPPDFLSLREQSRVLQGLAGYDNEDPTLTGMGDPRRLEGAEVTPGFFEVMGAAPVLGRDFSEAEGREGGEPVVILGDALRRELFAGSPEVLGRSLTLNGVRHTVVGVAPAGFDFPGGAGLWIPLRFQAGVSAGGTEERGSRWLAVVGRLRPGVGPAALEADLLTVARRLEAAFPETNTGMRFLAPGLRDELVGAVRAPLLLLMGAVGVVLMIACANVAGLLLARAAGRREELAVRAALGAGRSRLVGPLLAESLLLGAAGGGLGLLLAWAGTHALVAARPEGIPRLDEVRVDGVVLGFTLAVSLGVSVLVGIAPALAAAHGALAGALREGGRGGVSARSGGRLRAGLVVGELALAVVLLAGAGLLLRSFLRLTAVDPGIRTERVLSFPVDLPAADYPDDERTLAYYARLLERLEGLPGVEGAGAVFRLPFAFGAFSTHLRVEGEPAAGPSEEPTIEYRSATPGYFRTVGIPLRRGRALEPGDRAGAPRVAVINEAAARRFFPAGDPIGRRIRLGAGMIGEEPFTVVGVVGDVRGDGLDRPVEPGIFFPLEQVPVRRMSVVVRSSGEPLALAAAMRRELREIDPNLALPEMETLEEVVSGTVARPRFLASLLALFAAVAVALAAVGIFGLLSYTVAQRTREIGVRMALGAAPARVVRGVVGGAARLAAAGLALGLAGSLLAGRLVSGLLFEVEPTDPATHAGVLLLLGAATLVAALIPARRAAAVDPMEALRGP